MTSLWFDESPRITTYVVMYRRDCSDGSGVELELERHPRLDRYRIRVCHRRMCEGCGGEGEVELQTCRHSGGQCDCAGAPGPCPDCMGEGRTYDYDCDCDEGCVAAQEDADLYVRAEAQRDRRVLE